MYVSVNFYAIPTFQNMNGCAMDKKSNLEHLEKEVGLHKFLPACIINTTKQKTLRKSIQSHFKKFAGLSDYECHFRFLEMLAKVRKFDVEQFRCALGVRYAAFAVYFVLGYVWATLKCWSVSLG